MTPYQQCCEAIKTGDCQTVKSLYDQDRYVRKSLRDFMALAADVERTDMMDFFADLVANPVRGELLEKIAESGRAKSVKWMIDRGVMSNATAVQAALLKAIENQHLEVVKLLVEHGADINHDDVKKDVNPLAVATGAVREFLIEAGAKTLFQVRREAALRDQPKASASHTNRHRSGSVAFLRADEESWMAAIVSDQANDTLKLSYAEWLQQQCDPRGDFLKRFVIASHARKSRDFPSLKGVPETWAEMMALPLIQGIAKHELWQHRDVILRHARPSIVVLKTPTSDDQIPVGESKFGGFPDLPPNVTWPRDRDCPIRLEEGFELTDRLCRFMGQINVGELQGLQAAKALPDAGLLSIFCFVDLENDCPNNVGLRFIHITETEQLRRVVPDTNLTVGNEVMGVKSLSFRDGLVLPEWERQWKDDLNVCDNERYDELEDESRSTKFDSILGYSVSTTGDNPTSGPEWQHLMIIKSGVRLHLEIRIDDLKAQNFDAIQICCIDYD